MWNPCGIAWNPYEICGIHVELHGRVALQAMMKRSEKDQKCMYKVLGQEMVCMPHYMEFV